jgi:hypothetical protein
LLRSHLITRRAAAATAAQAALEEGEVEEHEETEGVVDEEDFL